MADVTATVRTVIAVVDQASGPLKGIQAQFQKFTAPLQGMAAKVKSLGDTTGLSKLGGSLGGIAQKAGGVAKSVAGIGLALTGLGGIAGGLGLRSVVGWMNDMVAAGGALHDTAPKLGVTVEQLQELKHWAQMGGVEAGTMQGAIGKLNKNLGDIATGKGKGAAKILEGFGVKAGDPRMKSAATMLPVIADGLKKIQDPAARAQAAMGLFGRAGVEMLPALLEGGKAIADAAAEARKLGIITSEDAKLADEFGEAQEKLGKAISAVQMAIGAKLMPVLLPVIEGMRDWITANRDWLAGKLEEGITAVGDALRGVDWAAWIARGQMVLGFIQQFVAALGGIDKAVALLAGVKFAGPLMTIGTTLIGLVGTIGKVAAAFGLFTPVGAVIAAIAAAAFLVWKNWDLIGPVVERTWKTITDGVGTAVDAVKDFAKGIATWLGGAIDAVADWGRRLVATFVDVWADVKAGIAGVFGSLGDVLGPALDPLKAAAERAWDGIKTIFEAGYQGVRGVIDLLTAALGSLIGLFDRVVGLADRALRGVRSLIPGLQEIPAVTAPPPPNAAGAERGPGPWLPDVAAAGGTAPNGTVNVVIENKNAPPGTRLTTSTSGTGVKTQTGVGYSMPWLQPAGAT